MASFAGLLPVFLILAAGVAARRSGIIGEPAAAGLNRLVANLALPALFVLKVGTAPLAVSFSARLTLVCVGLTVGATVVGLVVAYLWRLPRSQRGVLAQAAMRGNIAYVAFPIVLAVAGHDGLQQAAVTSAVLIPVMNLLAVAVLEMHRDGRGGHATLLLRVVANPMVAGALLGLVLSALHWRPWGWLGSTLQILSDFALPGALLALGAQLEIGRWRGVWWPTTVAVVLKLVAQPVIGWLLLRHLGVSHGELVVGILLLAAPVAIASYSVAAELDGDTDLAGACVLATTIASFLTYGLWTLVLSS